MLKVWMKKHFVTSLLTGEVVRPGAQGAIDEGCCSYRLYCCASTMHSSCRTELTSAQAAFDQPRLVGGSLRRSITQLSATNNRQ